MSPRYATPALVAAVAILAACGGDDVATLSGYQLEPAPDVASIVLPDASQDGLDFEMRAEDGHLLLVYFGYMSCPDVCPTSLNEVRKALGRLGDDAERVDLAMVTVDPARDTGENLTLYVQGFVEGAHALRTDDPEVLDEAAVAFGASYSVEENDEGEIEVGHSASIYAVDPDGTVVLTWPYGLEADAIATDLRILLGDLDT